MLHTPVLHCLFQSIFQRKLGGRFLYLYADSSVFPSGTGNKGKGGTLRGDFSLYVTMYTCFIFIQRLQRTCISCPVLFHNVRLMNMSQSYIVKARAKKGFLIDGNVRFISSVSQENISVCKILWTKIVIPCFPDFAAVIAKTIDPHSKIRKLCIFQFFALQPEYV